MRPVEPGLWRQVPGHDDSSDSEQEEKDIIDRGEERLSDITAVLGHRWVDRPLIKFSPPPIPAGNPKLASQLPQVTQRRWGVYEQRPTFRVEHAEAPVIRETFRSNGLSQTSERDFLIQWSGPSMRESVYQSLNEFQKVNHFPGSSEMTRKDKLASNFNLMAKSFGREAFDFLPETYLLPQQLDEFLECFQRKDCLWIVKPSASSRGRGIYVLRDPADLPADESVVVCQYISDPLLIQGLKFDVRFYVVVTSYDPLRAYIYREGLARFACKPYSTKPEHMNDKLRHLTNYSINKFAANFQENRDVSADNVGHKWSLSALNKHLKCTGVNVKLMWTRIMDLVMKTLLTVEPHICAKTRSLMPNRSNCFEVYGFDVIVDEGLKPWLLEVNLSPSMQAESPLDWQIKASLLSDVFNLVGVCHVDRAMAICSRLPRAPMLGVQFHPTPAPRKPRPASPQPHRGGGGGERGGGSPATDQEDANPHRGGAPPDKERERDRDRDRAGGGPALRPVMLDELSHDQLKLLARALQENRRCNNFVRLYPTRASIRRYAPITEALRTRTRRAGPLIGDEGPSMSEALASLLFGPRPVRTLRSLSVPMLPSAPRLASPPVNARSSHPQRSPSPWEGRQRPPAAAGSSSAPPRVAPGRGADRREQPQRASAPDAELEEAATAAGGSRPARQPPRRHGPDEEDPEEGPEPAAATGGSRPSRPARAEAAAQRLRATALQQMEPSGSHDAAARAVLALGERFGFELVLMEYLLRLWSTSEALGAEERAALARSAAFARLSSFRARLQGLSEPGGDGGGGGRLAAGGRGARGGEGSLVESLAGACRLALDRMSAALWQAETGLGAPFCPRAAEGVQLADYLPVPVAQRCRKELQTLRGLTAPDLEELCRHPRCAPEIRELFLAPYARETGLPARARPHHPDLPPRRPDSAQRQRRPGSDKGRREVARRTEPPLPRPEADEAHDSHEELGMRGPLAEVLWAAASAPAQAALAGQAEDFSPRGAGPTSAAGDTPIPDQQRRVLSLDASWADRIVGAKLVLAGQHRLPPPLPQQGERARSVPVLPEIARDDVAQATGPAPTANAVASVPSAAGTAPLPTVAALAGAASPAMSGAAATLPRAGAARSPGKAQAAQHETLQHQMLHPAMLFKMNDIEF